MYDNIARCEMAEGNFETYDLLAYLSGRHSRAVIAHRGGDNNFAMNIG